MVSKKDQDRIKRLFEEADKESDSGNYEACLAILDEIISIDPENAEAWHFYGFANNQLKRHEDAVSSLEEAIRLKRDYSMAYVELGIARNELGQREEAINNFNRAIQLDPKDARARHCLGIVKMQLGKFDEAIEDFDEAIGLNPKYEAAIYNRAAARAEMNANKLVRERLKSLVDTKELEAQSQYYKTLHDDLRKQIATKTNHLIWVLWVLVIGLVFFILSNYKIDQLSPLTFLPWVVLVAILVAPMVWFLRLMVKQANKAEIMEQEYLHLSYVEKRIFFYFGKDENNEHSKQLKFEYIKETLSNSPANKLVSFGKENTDRLSVLPVTNLINRDH